MNNHDTSLMALLLVDQNWDNELGRWRNKFNKELIPREKQAEDKINRFLNPKHPCDYQLKITLFDILATKDGRKNIAMCVREKRKNRIFYKFTKQMALNARDMTIKALCNTL